MSHTCHFPNCRTEVDPKLWGCKRHWDMLPAGRRAALWSAYRQGQEIDKNPSQAYIRTAKLIQEWIRENLSGEVARLAAVNKQADAQRQLAI